jgi:hypothetical protein
VVSAAFVIDIQSKLQPDSSERSEAYLRAILLSLNRSIVPNEDPATPPVWNGPPSEIVTTSNLLYASLATSLLAAFVAMLAKRWVSRYLRHSGGSRIERCGDRQRKFDGLQKWPFQLVIESLSIMLQIAILLLMCGLSRYVWSVNTSVARVVISFTVLGVLFYVGILAAGTSSYECPFQTPASIALRRLGGGEGLRIGRAFGNAKQRLARGIRRFRRVPPLPVTVEGAHYQPLTTRNGPRLRVHVRNLEALRKQNTRNARCVSGVIRNLTDPEAIDSAIHLAGTIRWFNGDPDHDPPFDSIVSAFEACFDATKQLYPGMRDRAYFSARAILQINAGARAQSHERASRYPIPIPTPSLVTFQHTDPDLHHIISMLENNASPNRPTLDFPNAGTNTHPHSLWMSNLFVDLTRVGPNPILASYESYLSVAVANDQPAIANTLLMWYMFLGGHVEEKTFWAADKSYVVVSPFSLSLFQPA